MEDIGEENGSTAGSDFVCITHSHEQEGRVGLYPTPRRSVLRFQKKSTPIAHTTKHTPHHPPSPCIPALTYPSLKKPEHANLRHT